jgi:hypothetical protein
VTGRPTVSGIYVVIGLDMPDNALDRLRSSVPPDEAGRDGGAPLTTFQWRMADLHAVSLGGYDRALRHYLMTREPWLGACDPPVIDHPLFVLLFEEVREQSVDDRNSGVAEGKQWTLIVPSTLVYLHCSTNPLPELEPERQDQDQGENEDGDDGTGDDGHGGGNRGGHG